MFRNIQSEIPTMTGEEALDRFTRGLLEGVTPRFNPVPDQVG